VSHRGKRLRQVPGPFVVAPPAGARVRTRLPVNGTDEMVLKALGAHLGHLASGDLARRVAEGPLDAKGKARSRQARKQALTAASSSRWAGLSPGPARTPTAWPNGTCKPSGPHCGPGSTSSLRGWPSALARPMAEPSGTPRLRNVGRNNAAHKCSAPVWPMSKPSWQSVPCRSAAAVNAGRGNGTTSALPAKHWPNGARSGMPRVGSSPPTVKPTSAGATRPSASPEASAAPGSGLSGHNGCQGLHVVLTERDVCQLQEWGQTSWRSGQFDRRCDRSSASCYDPSGVRRGLGRRRGQRAQGCRRPRRP